MDDSDSGRPMAGRTKRYFEIARRTATESICKDYKHGALLVRGGSIISSSCNKNSFKRWGNRFRMRDCGHATHHAELGCILGIDRSVTQGATVYVARIGKAGDFKMSKPCEMCEAVLRHVGVRKVIYTIDDKKIGIHKL